MPGLAAQCHPRLAPRGITSRLCADPCAGPLCGTITAMELPPSRSPFSLPPVLLPKEIQCQWTPLCVMRFIDTFLSRNVRQERWVDAIQFLHGRRFFLFNLNTVQTSHPIATKLSHPATVIASKKKTPFHSTLQHVALPSFLSAVSSPYRRFLTCASILLFFTSFPTPVILDALSLQTSATRHVFSSDPLLSSMSPSLHYWQSIL